MSGLPPTTVQVKRKATDEPVDILRVHENGKRQRRTTEFVFSRQSQPGNDPTPSSPAAQSPRPMKQLPRGGILSALGPAEVRRFHMSRSTTPAASQNTVVSGRVHKRTTIFVERKLYPSKSNDGQPISQNGLSSGPTQDAVQSRRQKKPGLSARTSVDRAGKAPVNLTTPASTREVRLPSGLLMPWNVDSEQLAAEMQAYTLQEIGRSVAQSEATYPSEPHFHRSTPQSRFKPKKPALRYKQRHPDEFPSNGSEMDVDHAMIYDEDIDDDVEYIVDTYIRVPAHEIDAEAERNFGLLVLDSQPDIDEFYMEDSDHEDEENDEEEDENGNMISQ